MKTMIIVLFFGIGLCVAGPSRVIDLTVVATNGGAVVSWTAPVGSTEVDLRYDTVPITSLNWSSKPRVEWLEDPGLAGTTQKVIITGLNPGSYYYFALKNRDAMNSWSTISNLAFAIAGGDTYTLTLAWDKSPSTNVIGYKLYYGISSRSYTNSVFVGDVTQHRLTGFSYGPTYYFAATEVETDTNDPPNNVESSYSNEVSYPVP